MREAERVPTEARSITEMSFRASRIQGPGVEGGCQAQDVAQIPIEMGTLARRRLQARHARGAPPQSFWMMEPWRLSLRISRAPGIRRSRFVCPARLWLWLCLWLWLFDWLFLRAILRRGRFSVGRRLGRGRRLGVGRRAAGGPGSRLRIAFRHGVEDDRLLAPPNMQLLVREVAAGRSPTPSRSAPRSGSRSGSPWSRPPAGWRC